MSLNSINQLLFNIFSAQFANSCSNADVLFILKQIRRSCYNLLSFLLWYGTRPHEWVTQWEWNSLVKFLSLRVIGLLFSSLLLFPQRFGQYVLRPSSGVCRTRETSRNLELRPLLNPRESTVLIPLAITGYKC